MNEKYKELSINTIIFTIGSLGSKLILFFLVPLYTNVLTPAEYGIADLVQTVGNVLAPVFSIMIQDSVLRFGLLKNSNKYEVLKCSLLVSSVGIICTIISCFFMREITSIGSYYIYLCIIIISNLLLNVMYSFVKTIDKNKLYTIAGIINAFLLGIFNIIFLLVFDLGINGYLLAIILSQIVSIIFLFITSVNIKKLREAIFNKATLIEMVKYSLPLILNNISWWILNSSDKVMIEYTFDASKLGLYSAAAKIPAFITILNSIFIQSWTISTIKNYDTDKEFFEKIFKLFAFVTIFAALFLMFILHPLLNVYVGQEYQECWNLIPLLISGAVFFGFSLFFGAIYNAAGKNKAVGISTLIGAIINIGINALLMEKYGIIIAAISTFVSYVFVGIFRMIHSRKYLKFNINIKLFIADTILLVAGTTIATMERKCYLGIGTILIIFTLINKSMIVEIVTLVKKIIMNKMNKGVQYE